METGDGVSMENAFRRSIDFALQGHWEELEQWLQDRPDLLLFRNASGKTLLHVLAGFDGAVSTMRSLLAGPAAELINAADAAGATPLGNAIQAAQPHGAANIAMVKLLVEAGADLRQFDETGNPALHAAINAGRADLVEYLLVAGADPLQLNTYGDDAYQYAAWSQADRLAACLPPRPAPKKE